MQTLTPMRGIRVAVGVAFSMCLSACEVTFTHTPLVPAGTESDLSQLEGHWELEEISGNSPDFLVFDGTSYPSIAPGMTLGEGGDLSDVYFSISDLGGGLAAAWPDLDASALPLMIGATQISGRDVAAIEFVPGLPQLLYTIAIDSSGDLILRDLNMFKLIEGIESQALPGEVVYASPSSTDLEQVEVRADPTTLRSFIEDSSPEIFSHTLEIRFSRLEYMPVAQAEKLQAEPSRQPTATVRVPVVQTEEPQVAPRNRPSAYGTVILISSVVLLAGVILFFVRR